VVAGSTRQKSLEAWQSATFELQGVERGQSVKQKEEDQGDHLWKRYIERHHKTPIARETRADDPRRVG